ncbi:RNA chaperone Hfq [Clostridiaceae bacterium NSJ-31]|uniref:RNA-binding protein Hfq n=1 Tax=Ligaoa zhengdingensis TaxID=2763658 RepID=A0A926DWZ8_9FIRM|nr:RNA chaperone Hfq [Ligaoa zhengdingensis]MBC8545397.1 RNA chaperone Hfq [Ligaoa zhengdingensis]
MKNGALQDIFLDEVRRQKTPVTVYLTNGFQLKGLVRGFDSFTLILDCEDKQNLVYKHAISTIIPARVIEMTISEPEV